MKILWSSNAPWAKTGYGNQTALFVPRIKALGHDVAIHAWYGLEGGPLNWNGTPVLPKAFHAYGQDVLGAHAAQFGADIAITLIDAWVMEPKMYGPRVKWTPWFPVDMDPIPPPVLHKVVQAFQPIVYSRSAERLCQAAGLDVRYVPHGVDTGLFKPMPQADARAALKWPTDRFIVGMVAANKGTPSRKALPQSLEAFARFKAQRPDALLYLHTHRGQEMGGVNLPELVAALGLAEGQDVLFADPYNLLMGYAEEDMAAIYNGLDVLLAASMGEGFGIPILEAQACGTPVITGDWTSMSELTWKGVAIPAECAERFWTPLGAWQFLPRVGAVADALEQVYRGSYVRYPPEQVRGYDADYVTANHWRPVLAEIAGRL